MTEAQRTRMMKRFNEKRLAAVEPGSKARALYKIIITLLGYGASVRTINHRSHQFHQRYGSTL